MLRRAEAVFDRELAPASRHARIDDPVQHPLSLAAGVHDRADHRAGTPWDAAEGWLCQAFEVDRQRDWPIAPLTLCVDGGEPDLAYWLRADPVHIKVSREGLHLVDSFTGTSASTPGDLIPVRDGAGARMEAFFPAGKSDVTPELVASLV